jgi:hypothetical protein
MCRLQGAQQQAGMSRFVCGAHRAGGVAGCGGGGGSNSSAADVGRPACCVVSPQLSGSQLVTRVCWSVLRTAELSLRTEWAARR